MREGVTMAKMYQVDKMAIMAIVAIMAFQLAQLSAHVRKVNQIESIKKGVSSEIVLKFQKNFSGQKIKLKARIPRAKRAAQAVARGVQIRRASNVYAKT